jgi:acetoin utilization protein AcuC
MRHSVAVYADAALGGYGFGDGHPFDPERLNAFLTAFERCGLRDRVEILRAVAGTEQDARLFHHSDYLTRLRTLSAVGAGMLDQGDTPVFPGIWEAALLVIGSVLDAVSRIMAGQILRAFVPIAGLHHARRDAAAGFCVLNDCGIAINALRQRHGVARVAYVDIDAHHGDGVFYAFESDPECFIVDFHEDGRFLYPGTGSRKETGRGTALRTKLNLPLPPGATDDLVDQLWPAVETFLVRAEPEFVILQCGADNLRGDPLAHLSLTAETHRRVARALCQIADTHCGGRLLALGGGGYDHANLGNAWTGVVSALLACDA